MPVALRAPAAIWRERSKSNGDGHDRTRCSGCSGCSDCSPSRRPCRTGLAVTASDATDPVTAAPADSLPPRQGAPLLLAHVQPWLCSNLWRWQGISSEHTSTASSVYVPNVSWRAVWAQARSPPVRHGAVRVPGSPRGVPSSSARWRCRACEHHWCEAAPRMPCAVVLARANRSPCKHAQEAQACCQVLCRCPPPSPLSRLRCLRE